MRKIRRPWGTYQVISLGKGFKVKVVEVYPKKRLSLQLHKHRSEHWVVVQGKAKITNGNRVWNLKPNESSYIPKKGMHRLENPGKKRLKIIEVQCGNYLGEDDIIRLSDEYGRVKKPAPSR